MSGSQIFVLIFAILSVAVSAVAVWLAVKAPDLRFKPLWIIGSLFGFVGFATNFGSAGDLYLQVGVQIPVISVRWSGRGDTSVFALFPALAAATLAKLHSISKQAGSIKPSIFE